MAESQANSDCLQPKSLTHFGTMVFYGRTQGLSYIVCPIKFLQQTTISFVSFLLYSLYFGLAEDSRGILVESK